jgi:hypothetical protein
MSHKGLLCPRRQAIEGLGGAALHLDLVLLLPLSKTSGDGIECIEPNMGELGSACKADSATEKASILSGVGSGEDGVKEPRAGDWSKIV